MHAFYLFTGVLSLVRLGAGEPTDRWYLMGGASVAALLLPIVATPLAWVAVELLVHQAPLHDGASELATNSADMVLQSEERHASPVRQDEGNCSTMPEERFPGTLDTTIRVDDAVADDRRPTAVLKGMEVQFLESEVYDVLPHRIDHSKFQSLNQAACVVVYISLMCFSLSSVCCKCL